MNRREFLTAAGAAAATGLAGGCATAGACGTKGGVRFGVCSSFKNAAKIKAAGFDYLEVAVASAYIPDKDDEAWKRQRDMILSLPLPLKASNGFIPGTYRLTGPKADFAPALAYAERALRRAEEVGVDAIVFGSGGARNVPGDLLGARDQHPDTEKGVAQYTEFCRQLCQRVSDLRHVAIVIEPLRPNESNIINYVWQGVQICEDVGSPRLRQLADIFHMMMGRESAESIVKAGSLLRHCHVASYDTRQFPGSDPNTVARLAPYFDALGKIGYAGGVSCECGWGNSKDFEKNLDIAIKTLKGLV